MKTTSKISIDPFEEFINMRRMGLRQNELAKMLGVTKPAVTYAFQGKSKTLIKRISILLHAIKLQRSKEQTNLHIQDIEQLSTRNIQHNESKILDKL